MSFLFYHKGVKNFIISASSFLVMVDQVIPTSRDRSRGRPGSITVTKRYGIKPMPPFRIIALGVFHGFYTGGFKSIRGGSSRVLEQISHIRMIVCIKFFQNTTVPRMINFKGTRCTVHLNEIWRHNIGIWIKCST